MIIKLLTEHNLELLSLKEDCTGSSDTSYTCKNTTLLEITCRGSFVYFGGKIAVSLKLNIPGSKMANILYP